MMTGITTIKEITMTIITTAGKPEKLKNNKKAGFASAISRFFIVA